MRIFSKPPLAECPHLGTAADPFARLPRASDEHRCYASLRRERVDLGHQRRFCLGSRYGGCPFLTLKAVEQRPIERIEAWLRTVSPVSPALTATRLGHAAELGAAAARGALAATGVLVVETWRSVYPLRETHAVREPALAVAKLAPAVADLVLVADLTQVAEPAPGADLAPVAARAPLARQATAADLAPGADLAPVAAPAPLARQATAADLISVADLAPVADPAPAPEPAQVAPPLNADDHLVERGIAALERGDDLQAHACFKRATQLDPSSAKAWFWRAKTAETLDDVIASLRRASALEPDNALVASNLALTIQRRDAQRRAPAPSAEQPASGAGQTPRRPRHAPVSHGPAGLLNGLVRGVVALAALLLAASVLLGALPAALSGAVLSAVGIPANVLPDVAGLTSLVHVPLGGGYDLGLTVPYAVAFLAAFLGLGVLGGQPSRPLRK